MASSPQLQPDAQIDRHHLRLAQVLLALFGLAFLARFVHFAFPFDDLGEIVAAMYVLLLPAAAYLSAVFMLYRWNVKTAEVDRLWAKWLLGIGLLAVGIGLSAAGLTIAYGGADRKSFAILFATGTPFIALFAAMNGIVLRRFFGPVSPAPRSTNSRELRVVTVLAWPVSNLIDFLRPIRSLPIGALLVLASLLLVTSANFGCSDKYYRGHQILTGEAGWLTAENTNNFDAAIINPVGRVTYAVALTCALVALVAVARSVFTKNPIRLPREFAPAVGLVTVFAFSDLGMFFLRGKPRPISILLWISYWVLPLILYSLYGRSRNPKWRRHWPLFRTFLSVLYFPLVLIAWAAAALYFFLGAPGFAAYLLGVQMLWYGAIRNSVAELPQEVRPSSFTAAAGKL